MRDCVIRAARCPDFAGPLARATSSPHRNAPGGIIHLNDPLVATLRKDVHGMVDPRPEVCTHNWSRHRLTVFGSGLPNSSKIFQNISKKPKFGPHGMGLMVRC